MLHPMHRQENHQIEGFFNFFKSQVEMILHRFLLDSQPQGYLIVLEMLFSTHSIDGLPLLWHVLHYHVDEQLGILSHHIVMRRGGIGIGIGDRVDVYRNDCLVDMKLMTVYFANINR